MVCPAKGAFMQQSARISRMTELGLYFTAVWQATVELVKETPGPGSIRKVWLKTTKRNHLQQRLQGAVYDTLIGRGIGVLGSFVDFLRDQKVLHTITSWSTDVNTYGTVACTIPIVLEGKGGKPIHVILARDYGKYDVTAQEHHPTKVLHRIGKIPYLELGMYTGHVGSVQGCRSRKGDKQVLSSLITQLDAGVDHPHRGSSCSICPYVARCNTLYGGMS